MVVETVLSSQPLLSVVFILFFLTSLAYACLGYFCYQIKMHLYSCLFIYYNLHFVCLFTDVKCCNCLAFKSEICMTWTCCCNMTSMLLSTRLCQGALFFIFLWLSIGAVVAQCTRMEVIATQSECPDGSL